MQNVFFLTNQISYFYFVSACEDADLVLLVGTNPRYEAPLLNTRLRKGYVHKEQDIAMVGPNVDLSYKYEVSRLKYFEN